MLLSLNLRDFVIVDSLELNFQTGFTVLSGETGAGKSILIDALALLFGDRADVQVVRSGSARAELSAQFDLSKLALARTWLQQAELDDEEQLLLRRTIDASGRSKAYINGRTATLGQLRELGEFLLDIHGQHAHQSLLRSDAQRALLDQYAGCSELAVKLKQAFQNWRSAEIALQDASKHAAEYANERERLSWQIEELHPLQLQEHEWGQLQSEHTRLSHAAALIEGSQAALNALSEGEDNTQDALSTIQSNLSELCRHDAALTEVGDLLSSAQAHLSEAVYALRHYCERLELDPSRLQQLEQRMDSLYTLARKYRIEPDQLAEKMRQWQARLLELGGSEGLLALQQSVATSQDQYQKLAKQLTTKRALAANKLAAAVSTQMQALAMANSRFEIALIEQAQASAGGMEQIEFQVSPHASAPARAISKVASGGELSRISLALQVVTSRLSQVPTLIFDEVDVGIGGRVAEIVGKLLKQLGADRQVLCITHLPQVAACGDQQLQVSKQLRREQVYSSITELDQGGRIEEIARMLGGLEITETTRQHAREMLGFA